MAQMTALFTPAFGFLLDGKWLSEGDPFEVRSPYDQSVVATVYRPGADHVEAAIQAAVRAFETTRNWPAHDRQRVLRTVAQGIRDQREDFARLLALEAGKPLKAARSEVDRAIFTFTVAAEESARIFGEWLPLDLQPSVGDRWAIVRRVPVGPVVSITPFNFPLNLVAHKWAPALASGCTVVHKPASQTPLCSLKLAQLVDQAGWPAGGLNVLPVSAEDAGKLIGDDRLKMLTFTGSGEVGWELKSKAGKKRVTLELGGNAGVIIHNDWPLDDAAERTVAGGFSYAGQSCISVQRVFVQRSVYEKFLAAFIPRVQKLRIGDPLDENTDVAPMINEAAARRTAEWVGEALAAGARLLCGGGRRGALMEPTVLTGTLPEMRINRLEVFAPVVTVEPYDDFAEAVKRVNDTDFGLQAGVFTRDAKHLFDAYKELQVGGVIAGDVPTFRVDSMPYGGVRDSGLGREGLRYAIEEMTDRKILVVRMP